MKLRRLKGLAFGLIFICSASVGGGVEGGGAEESRIPREVLRELEGQVLWADAAHENAVFVPERILRDTPLEGLPLDMVERSVLREEIKKFRDPRWGHRCSSVGLDASEQGEGQEDLTFDEYLRLYPLALVGEVVHIVPGWSAHHLEVAEAAYIRVEEVLWAREPGAAEPGRGSIVGILFPGGRTVAETTRLCKERPEGIFEPLVGDQIVVAGQLLTESPAFFQANARLPLVKGEVLAQPLRALSADEKAIALKDLRVQLRREGPDTRREAP